MRQIKNTRMNREHKKYFLVGSLCIAIFLMLGIGYAVLSQQLDINGTAQITSNWEILFTSAEEKEMTNATTKRKEITANTTLTLDVQLDQPGASATYDVVVENQGDLDAVLSSINGVNENNNKDPQAIKVSVENIKVGDPLLAGEDKTFQVKAYWDSNVDFSETNMQKEIEITLTYEQSDDGVPVGPIPSEKIEMGGQNVELVTSGDGLYEDSARMGRYVYKGTNPNNYIQFNNELWRIVAKETDGTYKIIRNETLSERKPFDVSGNRDTNSDGAGGTYCAFNENSYGCNVWASTVNLVGNPKEFTNGTISGTVLLDSTLNQYLNDEYLGTIKTNQDKIISHTWGVGATFLTSVSNNDLWELVKEENKFQWNGKVGMLSSSDLLLATSNENLCGTLNKYNENENICISNNYLVTSRSNSWWIISPAVDNNFCYYFDDGIMASAELCDSRMYVRPALYLSFDIQLSGTGTELDPYIIN